MSGAAARRGQAPAISVAILTAAVLVLALALYAYFSGYYSILNRKQALLDFIGSASSSVDGYIEYYTSNVSGGYYVYCYIVSLRNSNAGSPLALYVSVLPVSRSASGSIVVSSLLSRVPMDLAASPPSRSVYVFNFTDYDADGIVELVGQYSNGTLVPLIDFAGSPSCSELSANATLLQTDLNPVYADPSTVYLDPDNSITVYARGAGLESLPSLPLWKLTLPPLGKVSLFILVSSPESVDYASLAIFVVFDNKYYLAYMIPLVK